MLSVLNDLPPFAAGRCFSMFLTQDGKVYSCGVNNLGQCYSQKAKHSNGLVERDFASKSQEVKFKQIAARCDSAIALSEDNNAYVWGDNRSVGRKLYVLNDTNTLLK